MRIPSGEKRDRDLCELLRKNKKPVALFVDEGHDLNRQTLTDLKRLVELAEDGQHRRLSVVLAGHPKLRNDLRHSKMEEICFRTEVFSLDGIAGSQREYIHGLLGACSKGQAKPEAILTEEAIDLLATKLRTPLQIQQHLTLALEAGYQTGVKPVSRLWTRRSVVAPAGHRRTRRAGERSRGPDAPRRPAKGARERAFLPATRRPGPVPCAAGAGGAPSAAVRASG